MEAGNEQLAQAVVYELWSDDDMRWVEIRDVPPELERFLEAWCEKNSSIFRRRARATVRIGSKDSQVISSVLPHIPLQRSLLSRSG